MDDDTQKLINAFDNESKVEEKLATVMKIVIVVTVLVIIICSAYLISPFLRASS